jgi:hypothetical protein
MKILRGVITVMLIVLVGAVAIAWDEGQLAHRHDRSTRPPPAPAQTYAELEREVVDACADLKPSDTLPLRVEIVRLQLARRVAALSAPGDVEPLKRALDNRRVALAVLMDQGRRARKCQHLTQAMNRAAPKVRLPLSATPSEADAYLAAQPVEAAGSAASEAANERLRAAYAAGQAEAGVEVRDQASNAAADASFVKVSGDRE